MREVNDPDPGSSPNSDRDHLQARRLTPALRDALVFGHFRRGTNVKPEVEASIAAQRLNRLAQAPSLRYGAPRVLVCDAKKPAAT